MPDITMCSPTKIMKKCNQCYRFKAEPDKWQSYSNFYPSCRNYKTKYEFFIPLKEHKE
jgi:hypothetical protein